MNNKEKTPVEIIQEVMDFVNGIKMQEYEDRDYFLYNGGLEQYRDRNHSRALYILIQYFNDNFDLIRKEGFKWFEPNDEEDI